MAVPISVIAISSGSEVTLSLAVRGRGRHSTAKPSRAGKGSERVTLTGGCNGDSTTVLYLAPISCHSSAEPRATAKIVVGRATLTVR